MPGAGGGAPTQSGRIYTRPDTADAGGIEATVEGARLTHAIAVDRRRERVFLGELAGDARAFRFSHLPVGKYDLALVTAEGALCEGIWLGESRGELPAGSQKNLDTRIAVAEKFFNRFHIHGIGFDGESVHALVERIRDGKILRGSGEALDANLRRLEVIEFARAADDWQMIRNRHLYREPEPRRDAPPFLVHRRVPALGDIRVTGAVKRLGSIRVSGD